MNRAKPLDEFAEHRIEEAAQIQERITALKARLYHIEEELEPYFPQRDQIEHIATPFGTAHRVIESHTYLDPQHTHTVMAMLGSQFGRYFAVDACSRPTPELLAMLASCESRLGLELRPYLLVSQRRHFDFSRGTRVVDLTPGGTAC